MTSIVDYSYNTDWAQKIAEWPYGRNWPIVYIIYNATKAYVGETLDAGTGPVTHRKPLQKSVILTEPISPD